MQDWKRTLADAAVAGSLAGLASLAILAWRGRRENGSAWGPVNAPSHWLWGEKALRQDQPSLRYTATGVLIHQLSAGFWGVVHARLPGNHSHRPSPWQRRLRDAALVTAVAAWVDFGVVPHRLTPGFQRRLSLRGLTLVYTVFGLGLAAGRRLLEGRRR